MWWLWLPLGTALIVVAIASGSHLSQRGGPFIIGCLLVAWGVAGAALTFARRRQSGAQ